MTSKISFLPPTNPQIVNEIDRILGVSNNKSGNEVNAGTYADIDRILGVGNEANASASTYADIDDILGLGVDKSKPRLSRTQSSERIRQLKKAEAYDVIDGILGITSKPRGEQLRTEQVIDDILGTSLATPKSSRGINASDRPKLQQIPIDFTIDIVEDITRKVKDRKMKSATNTAMRWGLGAAVGSAAMLGVAAASGAINLKTALAIFGTGGVYAGAGLASILKSVGINLAVGSALSVSMARLAANPAMRRILEAEIPQGRLKNLMSAIGFSTSAPGLMMDGVGMGMALMSGGLYTVMLVAVQKALAANASGIKKSLVELPATLRSLIADYMLTPVATAAVSATSSTDAEDTAEDEDNTGIDIAGTDITINNGNVERKIRAKRSTAIDDAVFGEIPGEFKKAKAYRVREAVVETTRVERAVDIAVDLALGATISAVDPAGAQKFVGDVINKNSKAIFDSLRGIPGVKKLKLMEAVANFATATDESNPDYKSYFKILGSAIKGRKVYTRSELRALSKTDLMVLSGMDSTSPVEAMRRKIENDQNTAELEFKKALKSAVATAVLGAVSKAVVDGINTNVIPQGTEGAPVDTTTETSADPATITALEDKKALDAINRMKREGTFGDISAAPGSLLEENPTVGFTRITRRDEGLIQISNIDIILDNSKLSEGTKQQIEAYRAHIVNEMPKGSTFTEKLSDEILKIQSVGKYDTETQEALIADKIASSLKDQKIESYDQLVEHAKFLNMYDEMFKTDRVIYENAGAIAAAREQVSEYSAIIDAAIAIEDPTFAESLPETVRQELLKMQSMRTGYAFAAETAARGIGSKIESTIGGPFGALFTYGRRAAEGINTAAGAAADVKFLSDILDDPTKVHSRSDWSIDIGDSPLSVGEKLAEEATRKLRELDVETELAPTQLLEAMFKAKVAASAAGESFGITDAIAAAGKVMATGVEGGTAALERSRVIDEILGKLKE